MAIPSTIDRKFEHAFVVDEGAIRKFCDVLQRRIGAEVEIRVELRDGTTRGFPDQAEFLSFSNPRIRRITRLTLKAWSSRDQEMRIRINRQDWLHGIDISGTADDDAIVVVGRELIEVIQSARAPWSFIATARGGTSFVVGMVILISLLGLTTSIFDGAMPAMKSWPTLMKISLVISSLLIDMGASVVMGYMIFRAIGYLFPVGVFLIGSEKAEHDRRIGVRKFVGVTLATAFVISVLASLIANQLTRH